MVYIHVEQGSNRETPVRILWQFINFQRTPCTNLASFDGGVPVNAPPGPDPVDGHFTRNAVAVQPTLNSLLSAGPIL